MTQSICSSSQDQSSSPRSLIPPRKSATNFHRRRGRSVFSMLVQREMSPNAKFVPRKRWGKSRWYTDSSCGTNSEPLREAGQSLTSWVEAESLQHLSAKYCPLGAPPRSTIAAAFSTDGRTLASTHGDHTVKIIDCETGNCLKVLNGHQRTPWVVRFHPLHSEIVASGSLDLEVRLWNITTSECIRSHVFYRPIASIAFHAEGELLAVASGHKLHMWHYNRRGEESSPTVVLKTRRSLRAVHFHPHGAPFLLTAEVNEIDSLDSSMSRATSMGYLRYPPPAILFTSTESNRTSLAAELPLVPLPHMSVPTPSGDEPRIGQYTTGNTGQISSQSGFQNLHSSSENENRSSSLPFPLATSNGPSGSNSVPGNSPSNIFFTRAGDRTPAVDGMNVDEAQPVGRNEIPSQVSTRSDFPELGQIRQLFHFRDRVSWELPFLQGWLMAQGHGVANPVVPPTGSSNHGISAPSSTSRLSTASLEAAVALLEIPSGVNLHAVSGRGRAQEQTSQPQFSGSGLPEGVSSRNMQHGSDAQPVVNRVQSELATSIAASAAAAAAAAELPCTVKLRVWSHDIKDPYAQLKSDRCLFTIPHAVLCSEMGAHFSPCGRYLAACVACVFPHAEIDHGLQTQAQQDSGLATSPTRHPVTAHQVIYELRVYSLQKESFGSVLVSRAIRAAHCLTSIQFSPTSEHILLAYGRRHGSLLRSIVSDGEATSHFFTVLEIYRVSDMELVRVLPSSDDEVNVACFHPSPGGGLVYGTKEGKLRIFQYNTAATSNFTGPNTLT
ncbi:WD40-repeat-containing domain [Arabidopsis thaliana x Arabidopsis arenosa]|uniref:WD40-repeat-containing domain n=1 Tax=Arabidopsis thaliana x Arabidopsis arenosa TaxID=1240361 RepID=A0A8T1XJR6_9BRAS|nr:WD40-repeat-containing domain [Arabidopsis thaliana x Arabidopsis arenosa]KAG7532838.1 WD40-repeat-containing domain [Arabidopsis thaliana x Arabidopsis arenosa]KAG7532839.1 WD40-repeat-containing domain [Arabidopsis thaliana x Arabidopsis arenosa]